MSSETTYMSENGRVLIPIAVRQVADIRPKEPLFVHVDENGVHLQTRRQAIKHAQAIVRRATKGRKGILDEFLQERREEAARE